MIDVAFCRILFIFVLETVLLHRTCSLKYPDNSFNNETSCDIFCSDAIIQYIHRNHIFNDTKYFDNMKMKKLPSIIEKKFQKLLKNSDQNHRKELLSRFINSNFDYYEDVKVSAIPKDIMESPKLIDSIYDWDLRKMAIKLNKYWKFRGFKIIDDVSVNSSLFSQVDLPQPFVYNNNNLGDFYIWNLFLTFESLIASEMLLTAKNVIKNMLFFVKSYHYIPIDSKKYFIERPYLPILIPLFDLYFIATDDEEFLKENIEILEREFLFWMNGRYKDLKVGNVKYKIFINNLNISFPQADCYYEKTGKFDGNDKRGISENFKISGFVMDSFSLYDDEEPLSETVASLQLNALMAHNSKLLSKYFLRLGNNTNSVKYEDICKQINKSIGRIFWNDAEGLWFDYNEETNMHINHFHLLNLFPFWLNVLGNERDQSYIIRRIIHLIKNKKINCGGDRLSLLDPILSKDILRNWAPLYYVVNRGLMKVAKHNMEADDLEFLLAKNYVLSYFELKKLEYGENKMLYMDDESFNKDIINSLSWEDDLVIKFLSIYGHKIRVVNTEDPIPLTVGIILWIVGITAVIAYVYRVRRCSGVKNAQHIPLLNSFN